MLSDVSIFLGSSLGQNFTIFLFNALTVSSPSDSSIALPMPMAES